MRFDEIQHQATAVEVLSRAMQRGRLHHAYVFSGPDGVGKGMVARALAMALLCQAPTEAGGCGRCGACKRATHQQHPDLHIIERDTNSKGELESMIKIDQVRELQRALSFKAFEGGRRLILILEAERMNVNTSNALLKTLEEPGEATHFVLITHAPHRLLPTIRSRAQSLRFKPLPRAFVAAQLAARLEIDATDAALLAGLAEGSIGRGLALADSELLGRRVALLEQIDDPDGMRRVPQLLELAEALSKQRDGLALLFHLLRTWYRDLAALSQGRPAESMVHADREAAARRRLTTLSLKGILTRLTLINDAEQAVLEHTANARLSLERLLLKLVGQG
ncbi:DNA polymerase III subunit delta' [Myxococcota bacterium]|nr:DNA polymerase III subunit delta' [Myxococcota bacterium]